MSLLPGLHDNLPIGRALHASDRSCPAVDPTALPPTDSRTSPAAVARHGPVTAPAVPAGAARRVCRQTFGAAPARAARPFVCPYPRFDTSRLSCGPAAGVFCHRRATDAGRVIARVRTEG